jgi:hypothetical protein
MVQILKSCLTANAVLTLIDRIIDVPLNLFGSATHDPHHNALTRGALAAQCGIPDVEALYEVLWHLDRRLHQQLVLRDAACLKQDCSGGGASG